MFRLSKLSFSYFPLLNTTDTKKLPFKFTLRKYNPCQQLLRLCKFGRILRYNLTLSSNNSKLSSKFSITNCLVCAYKEAFALCEFEISTFCWSLCFIGENRKNSILRSKTLILQLALYLIFITVSEAKHPANILTASEHFIPNFAYTDAPRLSDKH